VIKYIYLTRIDDSQWLRAVFLKDICTILLKKKYFSKMAKENS